MTADPHHTKPGPREPLSAPESASTPVGGTPGGPGGSCGLQAGTQGLGSEQEASEGSLREQIAAALRASWDTGVNVHRDEAIRRDTDAVLAVRDRELEQLREELAARDAALAAYTAQLVHDQAALAAAKKCARGIGAWGVLQAIDNASAPAPDAGPTVAECAADDVRWFDVEKEGE